MVLSVVFAFASLALDYGRVQLSKTQFRRPRPTSAWPSTPPRALGDVATGQRPPKANDVCAENYVTMAPRSRLRRLRTWRWAPGTPEVTLHAPTGTARNGAKPSHTVESALVLGQADRPAPPACASGAVHASAVADGDRPARNGLVAINNNKLAGNSAASYDSSSVRTPTGE